MRLSTSFAVAAFAITTLAFGSAPEASAAGKAAKGGGNCLNKAASGTNTTVDGAKFQAWEAVLQATSWPMWSVFMSTSQKVGVAPGYAVKNLRSSCKPGGLGQVCIVQASLCK